MKLPQLEISPLEMLTVSDDFARIEAASKRSDCVVEGVGLKGGIIPFPLDAHLSVDLEACKKAGLTKRVST